MRTAVDVVIAEVTYGTMSRQEITQAITDIIRRHDELLVRSEDEREGDAHHNGIISSTREVK